MKKWLKPLTYGLVVIVFILLAIGYHYYQPDIALKVLNQKYGVTSAQYIAIDGMKVHYRTEGPASDTLPLVLLHGTSSSLYTWHGWAKLLKNEHRIIRLDLPGFGLTGPHPEGDYRVEMYLQFLDLFLAKLGVKQCILAGNSLGGEIAWRYTLNHPRQVKQLILIGAAGYPVDIEEIPLSELPLSYLFLRVPMIREVSVKLTTRDMIRRSLEYLYGNPAKVTDELVELYYDLTLREGNREALTERMESMGNPAPWEKISTITTPTLILWGGKDQLIPLENAKRFHQDLPNSTLVIFPDAGHMPMEEVPAASAQAAEKFISN